ncbi:hypothetical protein ACHQM5_029382 [Ranunculus cassubicifolius]
MVNEKTLFIVGPLITRTRSELCWRMLNQIGMLGMEAHGSGSPKESGILTYEEKDGDWMLVGDIPCK